MNMSIDVIRHRKWVSTYNWRGYANYLLTIVVGLSGCGTEAQTPPPPSPLVAVTSVAQETVAIYGEYVGATESSRSVELRARVEGFLAKINFKEGSLVHKDDLLFVIDPRTYLAQVHKVEASLARDNAALHKARQDAKRFHALHAKDAISTSRLEHAIATEKEKEATLAVGVQQLEQAKLNLSFTKIFAPLSGRIGKTEVRVGSLVGKGEPTLLATISQVDPVYVNVSISERDYLLTAKKREELRKKIRAGQAIAEEVFNLTMILADNSIYPYKGTFNFIDRKMDASTSTLPVRLEFPNPTGILRPGQFVRIRAVLEEREDALLVPQRAVQDGMEGASVFVVRPDNTVDKRQVKVGPRKGSRWVIEEGLNPGDLVIIEGIQKVRHGMQVTPITDASADPLPVPAKTTPLPTTDPEAET